MTIAHADYIAGMAKGLAVLESFDTQRQRLNATLAAERAGLTRAAARRHLLTLAHLGYLETDGSWFWLAPKVLRFSGSYLASARLPRAVQPTLNRLAGTTGESFSSVVLEDDHVVIVARSGSALQAYGLHLGARLPAHATSTGRVLLACKPRAEFGAWLKRRELTRLTGHTTVDSRAFRAIVEQVREQDWCVASEEHELGVHAVAVPLRTMEGRTVAALNVVTTRERVEPRVLQRELLPLLLEAAREVRPLL
ncbi:MAG TPA: IclR family transcriptional regulator C-terminal domain-containing protein [Ramlibacter sp.]|uniref:IclR family transcriptional regulator domain-containing protein n=1 Tax=Ramlibacter sp. TaxID=1917967 RepID=UPI002D80F2AA|nr:IclR family transcriptional regulator C-terminal domain-containing protein [Ramlibacter sp.]HET8748461.1 IclR family transcriptional regulator C-terminal domain-containing protein [Ramlibacter sp.]